MILVEWNFHDVDFTYPHEGLRSHISFGFRPIFLWAALDFCQCLPPASFRFHLTMNTLAFGYVIPAIRAYSGLAPVRQCSCRAYYIKGSLVHKDVTGEPLFCFRHCHPTNSTRTDYKNTFTAEKCVFTQKSNVKLNQYI